MLTLGRASLVDKGFSADVYSWGEGRVLKLFHEATDQAQREFAATRVVHSYPSGELVNLRAARER